MSNPFQYLKSSFWKNNVSKLGQPPTHFISNNDVIIYLVSWTEATEESSTLLPPWLHRSNKGTIFVLGNVYEIPSSLPLLRLGFHFLVYFKSLLYLSYTIFCNLIPTNTTSVHYMWPYAPVTHLPPFLGYNAAFHNTFHFSCL